MKISKFILSLFVVILALLFLLLKENEAKVAAETKLNNLQFKATSVINEKGNAISDLEAQQTIEEYTAALAERDAHIAKMNEDLQLRTAQHEEAILDKEKNISGLESQIKEQADKQAAAMKKKSGELSEIGEELRKSTERLAKALKQKEELESDNGDLEAQVAEFNRRIEKLNQENKRLEGLAKVCEGKATMD
jgi:chromosome segregation ATPase